MMYLKNHVITAISLMAVIFFALMISGCATYKQAEGIQDRINALETQTRQINQRMSAVDSTAAAVAAANTRLQADFRTTSDQQTQQLESIREVLNDLLSRVDRLLQQPSVIKLPPASSPGAGQTAGPSPSQATLAACTDAYDNAFTLVRRGDYAEAVTGFQKFIADCPQHENVSNAYYWIGESYYSQEQYAKAIEQYDQLLAKFPGSTNTGRTLYKLARCKQELGKGAEAKTLYEKLVKEHGGTLEAEQAAQRLKDM
jgi:tol-pal system protein YbgF